MDLIDIFRTFYPNTEEYTFFSSAHGTFSRIDHILGHKSNLSKFKKIEIVSSIFSDHNAIRLDIITRKKKTVSNTKIVGDFNTPLTPIDRSSKQKISKETQALNDTLDEMDLIDIFRTFHPNAEEYTFLRAHGTFSRIDHILGHTSNLSKFKKIEIVSSILSNHNTMRLDINYKKKL